MNDLKEWLLSKLPFLVPYQNSQIICGTQDFLIKFGLQKGIANPLNLTLRSKKKENVSSDDMIYFCISDNVSEIQSVKRLRNTPFFISSLAYENNTLIIIDFYEWVPVTSIYRIFYFQNLSGKNNLEIRLPKQHKHIDQNLYNIQDSYFMTISSSSENYIDYIVKIPISGEENADKIVVCAFSQKHLSASDLSLKSLISKINKLENITRKYHILNNIRIQNRKEQYILDELWCTQKGINPDRHFNKSHFDEKLIDSDVLLWTVELSHYMGWNDYFDDKILKKYQNLININDDSSRIFYEAYFNNNYVIDEIIDSLQSWWDQYSLPLYRMKFNLELKCNPSLIFVIYSLSAHLQLPWCLDLYRLCNSFLQEPQIAILANLIKLMTIIILKQDMIKIAPGPGIAGNVKSVRRGKLNFLYTHFGNKYFTSLNQENNALLKIDKEVIIYYNQTECEIAIKPNIIPLELNRLRINSLLIQLNNITYHIPLMWKKVELSLQDCRFRLIFKKDRFQITCQPEKSVNFIKINDKVIDTNYKRIIYYQEIAKSENAVIIKLLDISGRSYLLNKDMSKNSVQMIGWIQERHGLLVDHFNIRFNSEQILCKSQESGQLKHSFTIPSKTESIEILSKKIYHSVPIKKIKNQTYWNLMLYSPHEGKGMLLALVNDNLKNHKNEIKQLFNDLLGFIPFVLYKSEIKKGFSTTYFVHIDEIETLYKFENHTSFSKSSVLSLSYPEGMRNLFKILSA